MARRKGPATTLAPVRPIGAAVNSTAVLTQPSVRQSVQWSPAHFRSLALQADSGDLNRLGDLCDQMLADDRIGELLDTMAGNVLACDLTFEKGPRTSVGDAEKAKELEADWPLGFDDDELKQLLIWAVLVGVGFAKAERWVQSDNRIVPQLKTWHPKHFRIRDNQNPAMRTWEVTDYEGRGTPINPGDGTWVIVTRRGEFRPWANGLWRGLAPWFLLKQYAIQDWGIHSEKASKWVVSQNENALGADRSEDRKALANDIYDAAKNAVIALPVGFDMKLIEVSANTEQIYNSQINAANEGFTIAVLGQNLSTKVDGGSLAAAQAHAAKETRKAHETAKLLARPLQQQILSWWAEYNFGDRDLAPYPKWNTEPPEDLLSKAQALKTGADALNALKLAGYKLSEEQIQEYLGLEVVEVEQAAPTGTEQQPANQPPPPKDAQRPKTAKRPPGVTQQPEALLASGASGDEAPGFIRGQMYVDALSESASGHAASYMSGFVKRLSAAIDGAEDYEQVRAAVLQAFRDEEDPERLVDLVQAGIVLANLAGRNAVAEDAAEESRFADAAALTFEAAKGDGIANQPRVPKGNPAGGQWTKGGYVPGLSSPSDDEKAKAKEERAEKKVRERISNLSPAAARPELPSASRYKIDEASTKVQKHLSESETDAVIAWTGFSYPKIRAADMGDPNASVNAKQKASTLRRLVSEFEYDAPGALHRGMRVDPSTAKKLLDSTHMEIDSMTSWSGSREVARSFAHGETGTAVKGTRIPVILTLTNGRGLPVGGPEAEMVVGKNGYRILSRSNDNGTLRIHIEALDVNTRSPAVIKDEAASAADFQADVVSLQELDLQRFGSEGDDISFPEENEEQDNQ